MARGNVVPPGNTPSSPCHEIPFVLCPHVLSYPGDLASASVRSLLHAQSHGCATMLCFGGAWGCCLCKLPEGGRRGDDYKWWGEKMRFQGIRRMLLK